MFRYCAELGVDFIKVLIFFSPRYNPENYPALKKYITRGYQIVSGDVIIKKC